MPRLNQRILRLSLLGLLVVLLDPGPASSGWLVGKISGRARLVTGTLSPQPLPDVKVILTNLDWGRDRQLSTDKRGRFQFLNLPSGNYRVRVEKEGFRLEETRRESVIRLRVNEPVRVLPAFDMVPGG